MVERKVPNTLGIKTHDLKLDTQVVNLRPTSSQTLKKMMKKSRAIKRSDESRSLPPFKKKKTQPDEPRCTPNYMKSTSCFEARKEVSPKKLTPKSPNTDASRTWKVRSLTKTHSFKPLRARKKMVLCEDLDAKRATCSSTLKEAKFPNYLQLSPGGSELEGTSAMRVCPYTYCSLNGHHHAPLPPLKCFLSSKRRAIKTQKSFKLRCLSPRQTTPVVKKKNDATEVVIFGEEVDMKTASVMEEENRDFFVEINGCQDSDIEWEEGYRSASRDDGEEQIGKTGDDKELQDEESVSRSDEDPDSESDGEMKINRQRKVEEFGNYDTDVNYNFDEEKITKGLNLQVGDHNINYQQKETSQESNTKSEYRDEKNHTTIIYNIIQFNITVFINGEKTTHPETDKGVPLTEAKMESEEVNEATQEQEDEVNQIVMEERCPVPDQDIISNVQLNEEQGNEWSTSMDVVTESRSDEQTHYTSEITSVCFCKKNNSREEQVDPSTNIRGSARPDKEMGDSKEFNPRGPNFLPEVPDPDAEKVDLRHQDMDERKNAQEWMVDFALQQAVNTIAPVRKTKVVSLVEAFEKVMPIPTRSRHTSKAFTNARQMQACS